MKTILTLLTLVYCGQIFPQQSNCDTSKDCIIEILQSQVWTFTESEGLKWKGQEYCPSEIVVAYSFIDDVLSVKKIETRTCDSKIISSQLLREIKFELIELRKLNSKPQYGIRLYDVSPWLAPDVLELGVVENSIVDFQFLYNGEILVLRNNSSDKYQLSVENRFQ